MLLAIRRRKVGVALLLMLAIVGTLSDCDCGDDPGWERVMRDTSQVTEHK